MTSKKLYSLEFYLNTLECLGVFSSWEQARKYSIKHCVKFHEDISRDNDEEIDNVRAEQFYRVYYKIAEVTHLDGSKPIYLHCTGNYWCAYDWDGCKKISRPDIYLDHNPSTTGDWSVVDELKVDVPFS